MVPLGTMGLCWSGYNPFRLCVCAWGREGLWAVSKVGGLVRASRLPRFILLVSFSDTLLVIAI